MTAGQIAGDLEAIGLDPLPWEIITLRRLSRAFVGQRHDAEDPKCPEPRLDDVEALAARRQDVATRLEAAFRMMAAQQKPKQQPRRRKE